MIKMSQILNSAVFPGMQGGPLEHVIAAKATAFFEALQPGFRKYAKQVVHNARTMANAFKQKGYHIISGGTDNHLMLIDLRSKNLNGKTAEEALGKADITVNKNMVPFDTESPMVTSGIRIGTAAVTSRGFGEYECLQVVEWIDQALSHPHDEELLLDIRRQINTTMAGFPLYPEVPVGS
jgi:glycine hydroxymethyltransferase